MAAHMNFRRCVLRGRPDLRFAVRPTLWHVPHVASTSERLLSRDSFDDDELRQQLRRRAGTGVATIDPPNPTQPTISAPESIQDPLVLPPQSDAASTSSTTGTAFTNTHTSTDSPRAADAAAGDPSSLFDTQHVKAWTWQMVLWAPVGLVVAVIRMAAWVLGVLVDAPWFRNRHVVEAYTKLLGFTAEWRNQDRIPEGHHVMVSNHTTSADLMVLFLLRQRYVHLITTAMPAHVTSTRNLPVLLRPASPDVYDQLARAHAAAAADPAAPPPSPVHVFPEGGLTNGSGMMQFSRGFMKFVVPGTTPVVPVALRASTPWGVATHTLSSSFLSNLFWLSFCPWLRVTATVLPAMTPAPGEPRGVFVQRVQAAIADELGVPVHDLNIQQKRALMRAGGKARRPRCV